MGKGVQVKYHSFDADGLETVYERSVCRVYIMTIPTSGGGNDFLVLGTDRKTENSYGPPNLEVIVPPDELNFIEFNGRTYSLRNSSDLNICRNDIQTELALTEIA